MSRRFSLINRRLEKGLTQAQLAQLAGVSTQTVRNWESGRTDPQPDFAARIAHSLACDIRSLFPDLFFDPEQPGPPMQQQVA